MSSFAQQIMEPGGGLLLIPFVRAIIAILLVLTGSGFLAGIARIHMAVLSFLSAGLLFSISMFEREYKKAERNRGGSGQGPPAAAAASNNKNDKTDWAQSTVMTDSRTTTKRLDVYGFTSTIMSYGLYVGHPMLWEK